MTPFQPATIPDEELRFTAESMLNKWIDGDATFRNAFPASSVTEAKESILAHVFRLRAECSTFLNDKYQVELRDEGDFIWLSIKRIDREPCHDWRDFQKIKNELVGTECEGIELYPAESRLTDSANQYHLFVCKDPKFRFPFGWNYRLVSDAPVGKSRNRKLDETPS